MISTEKAIELLQEHFPRLELLSLPWQPSGYCPVNRRQAHQIVRHLAPGSRLPKPGWEVLLWEETTRDGFWRTELWLENQASPRNLEWIMGMAPGGRSPLVLKLTWRYDWRRSMD